MCLNPKFKPWKVLGSAYIKGYPVVYPCERCRYQQLQPHSTTIFAVERGFSRSQTQHGDHECERQTRILHAVRLETSTARCCCGGRQLSVGRSFSIASVFSVPGRSHVCVCVSRPQRLARSRDSAAECVQVHPCLRAVVLSRHK